jgi:hypothetical protein
LEFFNVRICSTVFLSFGICSAVSFHFLGLCVSNLILATGVPGEATEHKLVKSNFSLRGAQCMLHVGRKDYHVSFEISGRASPANFQIARSSLAHAVLLGGSKDKDAKEDEEENHDSETATMDTTEHDTKSDKVDKVPLFFLIFPFKIQRW